MKTERLMGCGTNAYINDMSLPRRKKVIISDFNTGITVEIPQTKRRNKYYSLGQLKVSEPETYAVIIKVANLLNPST